TVWPSASDCAVTAGAGGGGAGLGLDFGFGAGLCAGFGFAFWTTTTTRRRATRPSTERAESETTCLPFATRWVFQRRLKGARRSRLIACPSTASEIPCVRAPRTFARTRTTPWSRDHGWRSREVVRSKRRFATRTTVRAVAVRSPRTARTTSTCAPFATCVVFQPL